MRWPIKPITEKTTAEKQALLNETTLKISNLGKRVAASIGAEEELSHMVWADKVEKLAGDILDTNNLLVASMWKKLPRPLIKLIGLKQMTWKELADAVRGVTLEELRETRGRKGPYQIHPHYTKYPFQGPWNSLPEH